MADNGKETSAGEAKGTSVLPLTRVKKIITLDDDIKKCTNTSAFLVSIATELFVQHFAKQGFKHAQRDKRKTLQYKDLANVVSQADNLEFLVDLVPKTIPYKKVVERTKKAGERETGQLTLREAKGKANGRVSNGRVAKPSGSSRPTSPNGNKAKSSSPEPMVE